MIDIETSKIGVGSMRDTRFDETDETLKDVLNEQEAQSKFIQEHARIINKCKDSIKQVNNDAFKHIGSLGADVDKLLRGFNAMQGVVVGISIFIIVFLFACCIFTVKINDLRDENADLRKDITTMQKEIEELRPNDYQQSVLGLKMDVENLQIHDENTDERLKRLEDQ